MMDWIRGVARLPDGERVDLLVDRLMHLADMAEPSRRQAMVDLVETIAALPQADRNALVASHWVALNRLVSEWRTRFVRDYGAAAENLSPPGRAVLAGMVGGGRATS